MDLFLNDVFDGLPAPPGAVRDEDSSLDVDAVLRSRELHVNLAFCDAWKAVFGCVPPRHAYQSFKARLPNANAFAETLLELTPLRIFPRAQELLQKGAAALQATLARVEASVEIAKTLLLEKIADRLGTKYVPPPLPPASAASNNRIVSEYAALVMSEASLQLLSEFDRWSRSIDLNQSLSDKAPKSPQSVAEYYEMSRRISVHLQVSTFSAMDDVTDPLSGNRGACPVHVGQATCLESVRLAVFLDACLWRMDAGGALLVIDPASKKTFDFLSSSRFRFRTIIAPPAAVLSTLPPILYNRVLFSYSPSLGKTIIDIKTRLYSVDLVPICVSAGGGGDDALPEVLHLARSAKTFNRAVRLCTDSADFERVARAADGWSAAEDQPCVLYTVPAPSAWTRHPDLDVDLAWPGELATAMLAGHMTHRCPLEASARGGPAPADGALLFHQFLAFYLCRRGLHRRTYRVPLESKDAIVVIDTRRNVLSALSLLVTLDNLEPSAAWCGRVICSPKNAAFMAAMLKPQAPNIVIEESRHLMGDYEDLNPEKYSELMKSEAFWEGLDLSIRRILIVQDDGMLVRKGLERMVVFQQNIKYIGAPWADAQYNAPLKAFLSGRELIGNGGISMRDRDAMARCVRERAADKARLFNANLMLVPEDVFFVKACLDLGFPQATMPQAEAFAMEQRLTPHALGFHKPWPYVPAAQLHAWFLSVLSDDANFVPMM